MAFTLGTRLGAYEVLALLGSGGMGEVYRARDTRLERVVAIKVLPASVASDPDRRQRLDREARAISSLNHPHICTLYDVGHQDGIDYLVMEFLEGHTLAERLTGGALTLDQALQCAIQLADALDVAHRRGIVHRDLKPANVFISSNGPSSTPTTKLLDFGIAKASALGPAAAPLSATLTDGGTLLGTVQYMAPEQLEGQAVDARSDLFAFGAVLYEMLAGRRAFPGESQASVIAAVLDSEPPPLSASQSLTPPALEHLVKTCLAKNPNERWQTAGDVKRQLSWIAATSRPTAPATMDGRGAHGGVHLTWTTAVVTALVALIAGGALTRYVGPMWPGQTAAPPVARTTITTSGTAVPSPGGGRSVAITPDGTRIVYIGGDGRQIFVRPLDRDDSIVLYANAVSPLNEVLISPDGQSVGFGEGNTIKRMALTGGPATVVVSNAAGFGATWAADDTIIFPTPDPASGLMRVSAAGGSATALTRPAAAQGELSHAWPEILPGGRGVLFTILATTGGIEAAQIAVCDLATGATKVLVQGGNHAQYVSNGLPPGREGGHLVYAKAGKLVALPFNLARLEAETGGTPVVVVPRIATRREGSVNFSVAVDGTLVYVDALPRAAIPTTLEWVTREGFEEPVSSSMPVRPYAQPRVSPDGTQIAMVMQGEIGVWDVARQTLRTLPLTGPKNVFFPVWTTDGSRLIFSRPAAGLFMQRVDGTGKEEALGTTGLGSGMTPSGQLIFSPGAKDVMQMALDTRRRETLIQTPDDERNAVVSPSGRWLAYESNKTQTFEIYSRPYPNPDAGGPWLISTAGGTRPLWARNGQELVYVAPDGAIMSVPVDPHGEGWNAGSPSQIVEKRYETGGAVSGRNYDVSKDGTRFLMVKRAPGNPADTPQIQLVQHWGAELNRLVPTGH
jgi:serine/threonine-protein kinase